MEPILVVATLFAILSGITDGLAKMEKCRKGLEPGVKPSRNLLTFLFLD